MTNPIDQSNAGGYASRAGAKLHAALHHFQIDVSHLACADLGCSTGGFTDCLLQHGASRVYAVDTAYGELAWKLRQDERVTVLERTNALHLDPNNDPRKALTEFPGVNFVCIDLGWTKQAKAFPAAIRWLKHDNDHPNGTIITLIKPHYETGEHHLEDHHAEQISTEVAESLTQPHITLLGLIPSPIRGGKGKNLEFLAAYRLKTPA
ncbi:SAM-dependent methyltransferase [Mucisphaera sp.]|uniref:SAM-dependent methyltransferase n=1 Tax=Mucisphaera sp. TaxID=2913024 RepID=UPI003D0BDD12